jgi:carboxymethylenebutenolidase
MSSRRLIVAFCVAAAASTACHRQAAGEDHTSHMVASASGAVSGQGVVGLPASNGAAAARLAASPRRGEWIKVPLQSGSRDTITAWIVYPNTTRAKAPVVVIVHDITGLSTWARAVADQAAAEGFIAVSPDFTSRPRGAPSTVELPRDSAGKLMAMVNSGERNRIIDAVATYAMSQPSAERRYGVIGFCWGGGTTFMHVVNGGVG